MPISADHDISFQSEVCTNGSVLFMNDLAMGSLEIFCADIVSRQGGRSSHTFEIVRLHRFADHEWEGAEDPGSFALD